MFEPENESASASASAPIQPGHAPGSIDLSAFEDKQTMKHPQPFSTAHLDTQKRAVC
jgi:hypothetical protein